MSNDPSREQEKDVSVLPQGQEGSTSSHCVTTQNKKRRKSMEPRSLVWTHFTKYTTKDGDHRAYCNYCMHDYASHPTINGTISLARHLKGCMKFPHNHETYRTQVKQQTSAHNGSEIGSIVAWKFNQDVSRKACAYMIIVDEQPFNYVEKEGFRHFLSTLCPSFQIPSRRTVTRDCYKLYLEEKAKLSSFLKKSCKRISLTTDSWTSEQRINYMCLTAHFIDDDWVLHKKILNFCPIDSHKGEAIGKGVEKCLLEWGIDKVFSITVDNASSNDVAIGYLKKRFSNWGTSLLGDKHLHMRCVAHIINLVVSDGLKEIIPSINRVRAAVKYIRQSPSRLRKFKQCVEIAKVESKRLLCLDVPSRWNSTYLMLDTALSLTKAFERFEELDPHYKFDLEIEQDGLPTDEDWSNISRFVKFLENFYKLILRISGSLYVTSSLVLHELSDVVELFNEWAESDDVELKEMSKRMKEKYNKYWGNLEKLNLVMFFVVILDPRFKLTYVEWIIKRMYPNSDDLVDKVKRGIHALFEEYKKFNTSEEQIAFSSSSSSSSSMSAISNKQLQDSNAAKLVKRICLDVDPRSKKKFDLFLSQVRGVEHKSEFDKYIAEEMEKDEVGFDILKWWKMNALRFPILAQMARDILAVPVSTVASESAFSMGGRVLDTFRSSLTPDMVECLMCAKDWLRNEAHPVGIEEDVHSLEKLEEEMGNDSHDTSILDL